MIGLLTGKLRYKKAPVLIIECGGVGYEVEAALSVFNHLPIMGEETTVFTHLSIREDAHVLFAFSSMEERDLFRILIKVNGIGPKLGLLIVSGMSPADLSETIRLENTAALTQLPGIGKKTAERLIVELKDKFKNIAIETEQSPNGTGKGNAKLEAVDALVALGYKPVEAEKMVTQVYQADSQSEDLIRQALQAKLR